MKALGEKEIRGSFVNCSKGEAQRLGLPREFAGLPWADLDFLGWRDPGAPERGYLVTERDGGWTGFALRGSASGRRGLLKSSICSICVTPQSASGIDLMTAPKVGVAGRQGNTVGMYMCADLACSLYVRGKRTPVFARRLEESLTLEEKLARARTNLDAFLDSLYKDAAMA
ncbi:FBP domain-containing protein [Streptomyces sp. NPDC088554]|uniref:FBP domain-containing protein n=1 Tax=Streptomyces sp. NPDC088554 TaxID=3365865 RepID=UPI003819C5A2